MKLFDNMKILECIHFTNKSPKMRTRTVKDYEFDLYIDGEREMYINNKHHYIASGALVFRYPGQKVSSVGDYNAYILTVDFSEKNNIPIGKYSRSNFTPMQEKIDTDLFDEIPEIFYPVHLREITELYKKIMKEMDEKVKIQHFKEFLFLLLYDAQLDKKNTPPRTHLEKACDYIDKNYAEQILLEDIANHVMLNKNYLIRLFKQELNTTPNAYLTDIRLSHAHTMIMQSNHTIKYIALSCGFNTPSYFSECFRKKYGKNPKSVIRSICNDKKTTD